MCVQPALSFQFPRLIIESDIFLPSQVQNLNAKKPTVILFVFQS